ncbi:uncharacterized protein BT62DRAFT_933134 [Guyanagaster necrorhizus]|uniref:Uncharacterized protein n=1 Tax=Guyanagaster necrorhizus TaxID=856835 RepID=A0A9P8ARD7_9AGAR|nr:uncharacterized protein BT62DRAFT_933134 [Guyanagaster necrorhizus MCA 3950]KAG7445293.1 hypothetical protein BT62DRAFT_933134 [Guyanagaster necrorhizus MCA 3950]
MLQKGCSVLTRMLFIGQSALRISSHLHLVAALNAERYVIIFILEFLAKPKNSCTLFVQVLATNHCPFLDNRESSFKTPIVPP